MNRITIALFLLFAALLVGCYEPVSDNGADFEKRRTTEEAVETPSAPGSETNAATPLSDEERTQMNETNKTAAVGFRGNVDRMLAKEGLTIQQVVNESSPVEKRVFEEYGAIYLTKAKPPSKAMFADDAEVAAFQAAAGIASENLGGVVLELQPAAMEALLAAREEARSKGLSILPRDGAEAGRRTYSKTLALWKSRFEPALRHWKGKGRLSEAEVARLQQLPIKEQVADVLKLEKQGVYFNTFFNDSILFSVAAPGTSQHLAMLAFDVTEYSNPRVQEILANHGWFR
ncbi:MAG: hypothetical protein OEQ28_12525, partial [Acidobacteriota bacterium]|nr:hypothetical protein [Acidobacteriota bacterium]